MFNLFEPIDDFSYLLDNMGKDIQINNNPFKAVISSVKVNKENDDKYISTLELINQGDFIFYDNQNWLIISEINGQRIVKYKGIMRKCNYNVNFNFDGLVKTFPTIIEGKVFDVQSGQYITLPTGKILATLQENPDTLAIALNQRFIKMGSAWKITGIDRTKKGLITLNCDIDQFSPDDDKINEIANVVVYTVTFSDSSPIEIDIGNTYQTTIIMQKNGASATFPVSYSSDNSNVAVDENGLLTANTEGTSIITVYKTDNPSVSDTLDVTAKVNHVPVVEDRIDPQTTDILQSDTVNYTVFQYIDSVPNSDTFTITASGPTTAYYTLTVSDGNHFSVYNNQMNLDTPLVVNCVNNRTGSSVSISINLKGLW